MSKLNIRTHAKMLFCSYKISIFIFNFHLSSPLNHNSSHLLRFIMAETNNKNLIKKPQNSTFSRRVNIIRRRKVQSIRLGGKKRKEGFALVSLLKRAKQKWLKLKYTHMLNRLKAYYHSVVKDFIAAGATYEGLQQRIMMETYFTVPVMGVPSYMGYPSRSNQARSVR